MPNLQDIDFLPDRFRQTTVKRRNYFWRSALLISIVLVGLFAALHQHHVRAQAQAELAVDQARHDQAKAASMRMSVVQAQLAEQQKAALLIAYLDHPWPATRLLEALLEPLPDSVVLEEIRIVREQRTGQHAAHRPRVGRGSEEEELAGLPPIQRDLTRLRLTCDGGLTVALVAGLTTDSESLHRYIGRLNRHPLVSKAELTSIEVAARGRSAVEIAGASHFSIRVVWTPGYGQPAGPTGPLAVAAN
jgi:Tfp pilus assembly protein PilN